MDMYASVSVLQQNTAHCILRIATTTRYCCTWCRRDVVDDVMRGWWKKTGKNTVLSRDHSSRCSNRIWSSVT